MSIVRKSIDIRIPKLISTLKTMLPKYNIIFKNLTTDDSIIRTLGRTGYGNISYIINGEINGQNVLLFNHTFYLTEFGGCCGAAVMRNIDTLTTQSFNNTINIEDKMIILSLIFSYIFNELRRKAAYFRSNSLTNGMGVVTLHFNTTNEAIRNVMLTRFEGEIIEYNQGINPKTGRRIFFFCTQPHI